MNGKSSVVSIQFPFVLSLVEGRTRVFQRNQYLGKTFASMAPRPSIIAYQDKLSDSGQFSRNNSALTQQARNLPLL